MTTNGYDPADTPIPGWAILELMGHRRIAGHITEETIASASFLRIDIPGPTPDDQPIATQLYAPSAVYAITPCSEDTARTAAQIGRPTPVQRWELPPAVDRDPADVDEDGGQW